LQGFLLQVEVSEIIVHEADKPNAVVDFLDAEFLAGQHGGDVDPLAIGKRISALPHVERTSTFVAMETVNDR